MTLQDKIREAIRVKLSHKHINKRRYETEHTDVVIYDKFKHNDIHYEIDFVCEVVCTNEEHYDRFDYSIEPNSMDLTLTNKDKDETEEHGINLSDLETEIINYLER